MSLRAHDRFRSIDREAHEAAIAAIVLDNLRREGMEPHQVLLWCHTEDRDNDEAFEATMEAEHGIRIHAANIKDRVRILVVGQR